MFQTTVLLVLLTASTLDTGAPQPCPRPCRCLKFEGLWSVYCNGTAITSIPTVIPSNTQLLDLSYNSLSTVPRDSFTGLLNLQELFLAGTGLMDGSIADKALNLPQLQSIELSGNSFTQVPSNLPRNMTYLGMYGNKIAHLRNDSFVNYLSLTGIALQQNGLQCIDVGTFDALKNVSEIDLSFNQLTDDSLPLKLFSKNSKLDYVSLRFNRLKHIVKDMPPSTLHLDYVGNQITTIPAFALQSMPNLQTIEFWQGQASLIVQTFHRQSSINATLLIVQSLIRRRLKRRRLILV